MSEVTVSALENEHEELRSTVTYLRRSLEVGRDALTLALAEVDDTLARRTVLGDEGRADVGVGSRCSCDFASWKGHDELHAALNELGATDILRLLEIVDEWHPQAESDPNYPMPGEWPLFAAQHNWRDQMLVCRFADWFDHMARLIRQHDTDSRALEGVRAVVK